MNTLIDRDAGYWQRWCDTLGWQMDELVYDLYGLTDEDIARVEGAGMDGAVGRGRK